MVDVWFVNFELDDVLMLVGVEELLKVFGLFTWLGDNGGGIMGKALANADIVDIVIENLLI